MFSSTNFQVLWEKNPHRGVCSGIQENAKYGGEIGLGKVNTSGVIMFLGCMCIFVRGNYVFVYIEKVKCMYEDTGRQKKKKKKVQGVFVTLHSQQNRRPVTCLTANNNITTLHYNIKTLHYIIYLILRPNKKHS